MFFLNTTSGRGVDGYGAPKVHSCKILLYINRKKPLPTSFLMYASKIETTPSTRETSPAPPPTAQESVVAFWFLFLSKMKIRTILLLE